MPDDLGLLLDAIILEAPARNELVAVAAKGMAPEEQVHAPLVLPNVDQLVDQVPLLPQRRLVETVAIELPFGVEIDMPTRRHGDASWLERPPFAPVETDAAPVDRVMEDRSRQ